MGNFLANGYFVSSGLTGAEPHGPVAQKAHAERYFKTSWYEFKIAKDILMVVRRFLCRKDTASVYLGWSR